MKMDDLGGKTLFWKRPFVNIKAQVLRSRCLIHWGCSVVILLQTHPSLHPMVQIHDFLLDFADWRAQRAS